MSQTDKGYPARPEVSADWVSIPVSEFERLSEKAKEAEIWEARYDELLAAVGGVWPG